MYCTVEPKREGASPSAAKRDSKKIETATTHPNCKHRKNSKSLQYSTAIRTGDSGSYRTVCAHERVGTRTRRSRGTPGHRTQTTPSAHHTHTPHTDQDRCAQPASPHTSRAAAAQASAAALVPPTVSDTSPEPRLETTDWGALGAGVHHRRFVCSCLHQFEPVRRRPLGMPSVRVCWPPPRDSPLRRCPAPPSPTTLPPARSATAAATSLSTQAS